MNVTKYIYYVHYISIQVVAQPIIYLIIENKNGEQKNFIFFFFFRLLFNENLNIEL